MNTDDKIEMNIGHIKVPVIMTTIMCAYLDRLKPTCKFPNDFGYAFDENSYFFICANNPELIIQEMRKFIDEYMKITNYR